MIEWTVQERRRKILELLHSTGKVRVSELSGLFGVSEVSIRNDLAELEEEGLLSRIHGGAVSSYESYYNMSLAQRTNTNKAEKAEIARRIAGMIHDNQTVMLNAGTTTLAVMNQLVTKRNVTIVTNSIVLALEGAKHKNLRIILLGGDVNYEYQFVYGTITLVQLKDYNADVLVLSADGIDAEEGVTTYYDQEAEICRAMIERSRTVIAALDHTKIGRVTFRNIVPVEKVDCVVTTAAASSRAVKELESRGVTIMRAERNLGV